MHYKLSTSPLNERQAGNRRRRVVNTKLSTVAMKVRDEVLPLSTASLADGEPDAPVIDGESIVCGNEPSNLVAYRVAYRHCQQSPLTS